MLTYLKQAARRALARRGYVLHRRPWLPRGVDPLETIHAILPGWAPRHILDVGANIGEVSRRLADHFPTAQVHAFEPIAATFNVLVGNVRSAARIQPHRLALGDATGHIAVRRATESTLTSLVDAPASPDAETSEQEIIEVTTIDSFCASHGISQINLLKTDTEGFELQVLAGAARMFREGCVEAVLVEAGLVPGDRRFVPLHALAAHLGPLGFLLVGVYDQHGWNHRLGAEFCNALFLRTTLLPA